MRRVLKNKNNYIPHSFYHLASKTPFGLQKKKVYSLVKKKPKQKPNNKKPTQNVTKTNKRNYWKATKTPQVV